MAAGRLKGNPLTKKTIDEKQKNRIAMIVMCCLFGFVLYRLRFGIGFVDESLYYTIAKRFAEGDRLFADEWKVVQTFTVFLIIPYKIYVRIVGSTDGLILFMRYLYILSELIFSLYLYRKLRKYGWIAFICVLMLSIVSPILNFSYYNITINCVALLLVERFASEEPPSKKKLVVFGLIASCAVISHPILSVAYVLYSAQVFALLIIKRKKEKTRGSVLLKPSLYEWKYITVGILFAFAVFVLWFSLSYHFDFTALWQNLPELFNDPAYSFHAADGNNHFFRLFFKMVPLFYCYGYVFSILGILLLAAVIVWRCKGRPQKYRVPLFMISCADFFLCYLHLAYLMLVNTDRDIKSAFYTLPIVGLAVPIILFGFICFLMSEKPQPMCFAFLQTSVIVSALVDFTSFVCFSYAGLIALFPMLVCFRDVLTETRVKWSEASPKKEAPQKTGEKKNGKSRKRSIENPFLLKCVPGLLAALIVVPVVLFGMKVVLTYTFFPSYERYDRSEEEWQPMDQTLERGPLKGIKTTERIATQYNKMLNDMELIERKGDGPLYVHATLPYAYLSVGLPVGAQSAYGDEELRMDRELRYWELHPDRIPAIVYLPTYNSTNHYQMSEDIVQQQLEILQTLFDVDVAEGEAGYILTVNKPLLSGKR